MNGKILRQKGEHLAPYYSSPNSIVEDDGGPQPIGVPERERGRG